MKQILISKNKIYPHIPAHINIYSFIKCSNVGLYLNETGINIKANNISKATQNEYADIRTSIKASSN